MNHSISTRAGTRPKGKNIAPVVLVVLMAFGGAALLGLFAWMVGVTPASTGERDFIVMLKESPVLKNEPAVAAVVREAELASYVSRRHFLKAEEAFIEVMEARTARE